MQHRRGIGSHGIALVFPEYPRLLEGNPELSCYGVLIPTSKFIFGSVCVECGASMMENLLPGSDPPVLMLWVQLPHRTKEVSRPICGA